MTIKTREVWVVLGNKGQFRMVGNFDQAEYEASERNRGPYLWKPYRVVRAELRYPVKGKGE
jgi:hypothetical protein